MKNYSIIIPHYNRPNLLIRLLESIPNREDIEIIVVDDNSKIDNFDFECFWSNVRNRAIVILNKNGGSAGRARNIGLKEATGKWLIFLDSDDFFLPEAFDVFDKYCDCDKDIIFFGTTSVFSDTGLPSDRNKYYNHLIDNYLKNANDAENILRFHFSPPWAKMIRHDMVKENNILFDEVKYFNDCFFTSQIGVKARKITATLEPVYCITVESGSLIYTESYESNKIRYLSRLHQNKYLRDNGYGKYQRNIIIHLRKAFKFKGIKGLIELIKIGRSEGADFFHGWYSSISKLYKLVLPNPKKKYIKVE